MREIKFRAWDKDGCKMMPMGNLFNTDRRWFKSLFYDGREDTVLMQYTGLKDSYATEEYFSDIIQEEDGTIRIIEDGCSAVLFRNLQVTFNIKYFWELKQHGIIGNIYENPELYDNRGH